MNISKGDYICQNFVVEFQSLIDGTNCVNGDAAPTLKRPSKNPGSSKTTCMNL